MGFLILHNLQDFRVVANRYSVGLLYMWKVLEEKSFAFTQSEM